MAEIYKKTRREKTLVNFEDIIDNIPSGIIIFRVHDTASGPKVVKMPEYMSRKACEILGYSRDEYAEALESGECASLIDRQVLALTPGQTLDRSMQISTRPAGSEEVKKLWLRSVCTKKKSRLYFTIVDITEGIERGLKQRMLEERCRLIIENSDVITFDYDPQTDLLTYSMLVDGERREVAKEGFAENLKANPGISKPGISNLLEAFAGVKRGTLSSGKTELELTLADQRKRWYEIRYTGVRDPANNMFRIVGRIFDIQDVKTRDTMLAEATAHETAMRRTMLSTGGLLMLEFDMMTGVRIRSEADIIPQSTRRDGDAGQRAAENPNLTISECLSLLGNRVHTDDLASYNNFASEAESELREGRRVSCACRIKKDSAADSPPEYIWAEANAICLLDMFTGRRAVFLCVTDASKQNSADGAQSSEADPLTGLLNRSAFEKKFVSRAAELGTAAGCRCMLLIELTSLEKLNRRYGYVEGDRALMKVADTLQVFVRDGDFCARIRAAQFAFFMGSPQKLPLLKERIRILCMALTEKTAAASGTEETDTRAEPAEIHIGAAEYPSEYDEDGQNGSEPVDGIALYASLFSKADLALCCAKNKDSSGCEFYTPDMSQLPETPSEKSFAEESDTESKRVFVRALGYFDVFVDGRAIMFKLAKAKELLAILVDRRGGFVTASEAITCLWEDEPANKLTMSRYRKVAMRLKNQLEEYGIGDIIEVSNGSRRIIPERVNCDYYNYLSGAPEYQSIFKGYYLTNYSWAEDTLASLEEEKLKREM